MARTTDRRRYKVIFTNRGEIYEIYARSVSQGDLFGFIQVEQLAFGERSQVVVDPSEETLKIEFRDVKRTYIPMHAVMRIDEVDREGVSRITPHPAGEAKLTPFPTPMPEPPKSKR